MRTRTSNALFMALAAVLAYAALHLTWAVDQLREVGAKLREEHLGTEDEMNSTTTITWTSGGSTVTVTTTRGDDETEEQWANRTKAEVDAQKTVFPPDE